MDVRTVVGSIAVVSAKLTKSLNFSKAICHIIVATTTDATVIFLVRADGLSTYYAASKLCDDRSIRNGKLPVAGDGRVDLSRFVKKEKK